MLKLEKDRKNELKKPLGKLYPSLEDIIDNIKSAEFLISVGDATTINLINNNIFPNISIIDNLIQRKSHAHEITYASSILKTKNPPGNITDELWETIELSIKRAINGENQLVIVEGEEDLAVIPCIIIAPEESIILYGQPNEGLVLINVKDMKDKVNNLIDRLFKRI